MTTHLGLQRILLPTAQVSSLTTGSITLPSARGAYIPGAFDSISTQSISSDTASVTFSSIPQTYTHLQIRAISRSTRTDSTSDNLQFQFNSDTGTTYNFAQLYAQVNTGNTSTTGSGSSANTSSAYAVFGSIGTNSGANYFGCAVTDILDYSDTTKVKTLRSLGYHGGGNGNVRTVAYCQSTWRSTSAITSITVFSIGSQKQYSHIALYGIRSAS